MIDVANHVGCSQAAVSSAFRSSLKRMWLALARSGISVRVTLTDLFPKLLDALCDTPRHSCDSVPHSWATVTFFPVADIGTMQRNFIGRSPVFRN